jgi:hypothetical protein
MGDVFGRYGKSTHRRFGRRLFFKELVDPRVCSTEDSIASNGPSTTFPLSSGEQTGRDHLSSPSSFRVRRVTLRAAHLDPRRTAG